MYDEYKLLFSHGSSTCKLVKVYIYATTTKPINIAGEVMAHAGGKNQPSYLCQRRELEEGGEERGVHRRKTSNC